MILWIVFGAIGLLIFMNCLAFWMFAWDKWCAENGRWRIPEADLLLVSLLGGSVGAIAAQQWLRHKTRKEPFATILFAIGIGHGLLLFVIAYSPTRYYLLREIAGPHRSRCLEHLLGNDTFHEFASCWAQPLS